MNKVNALSCLPDDTVALRLRQHGITPTRPRIAVGSVLFSAQQHITAEQLQARLVLCGKRVSKATVYNTLNLFAQKGLVREVVVDTAHMFYDSNIEPHHHVFHTDSGELEDIASEAIGVTALPDLPEGVNLEGVDVIIRVSGMPAVTADH